MSKPVVSKNLKDKTVKEKDMEGKPRPGDVVGCQKLMILLVCCLSGGLH